MDTAPDARWDHGLTGVALQIASATESPLRVVAGPGTGKTFAMKRRVMRLLQEGENPRRILACTFTRTAARDIASEIASLGVEGVEHVRAGTLHALCFSVLRKQEVFETTGRNPRPLIGFEERFLLEDLKAFGGTRQCEKRLEAFAAAWARLQTDEPGWPTDHADRAFQASLLAWLRFHRAMLVGEMVPVLLQYLRDNPLCGVRRAYDHVLVDEFQDLNRAEQVLVDLLASNGTLTIIGDEDQSIYSFKHAHPQGISDFDQTHPGTHDETLDICRRCPTRVVDIAKSLIANNTTASRRALQARPENGEGVVRIVQWPSVEAESEGIASFIAAQIDVRKATAGRVLVLAPRRQMGYAVRDSLGSREVVAHSFFYEQALEGNPKILNDSEAQQAFTLLTLLTDPEDRVALRCWCGFGHSSLGEAGWRRLRARAENSGESLQTLLRQLVQGAVKIPYTDYISSRYAALVQDLDRLANLKGQALADGLFPTGATWAEPLRAIVASSFPIGTDFSAQELLDAVRSGVTQPELPTDVDYVRIMSLHKSKGLTADLVVILGAVEGAVPRVDYDASLAEQQRQLEEQRRLFYVALTRTTKILVISSVTHLPRDIAWQMGIPVTGSAADGRVHASRFLAELGPSRPAAVPGSTLIDE